MLVFGIKRLFLMEENPELATLNHNNILKTVNVIYAESLGCGGYVGDEGYEGGGGELFACPYPLKFQAHPPRDQTPPLRSRVSGQNPEALIHSFHLYSVTLIGDRI